MDEVRQALDRRKVSELNQLCKLCKIPAYGLKAEIVSRIFEHVKAKGESALEFWKILVERELELGAESRQICSMCKIDKIQPMMNIRGVVVCLQCRLISQSCLEDVEKVLVKPFYVSTSHQSNSHMFNVSHELLSKIKNSGGQLQIQVRCIKVEPLGFLPCWPALGWILLDSKIILEFLSREPNEKKRKDDSLNITSLLEPGDHSIDILAQPGTAECYYLAGVYLIRKKSNAQIRDQVLMRESKPTFQEAFDQSTIGIRTEQFQLSLLCPISKTPIKTPVKGILCKHLGCFDLDFWVELQRTTSSNRYKCPLCNSPAVSLYKDPFFSMILERAQSFASPHSVKIFANGEFEILDYDAYFQAQNRLKRKASSNGEPKKRHKESSYDEPIDLD